ncbi:MAG: glycoside hydrolase family 3 protein [Brevinematales bacterium]|nr:glycoside hydrolase family 3 protein [Brevinematales bacterium]
MLKKIFLFLLSLPLFSIENVDQILKKMTIEEKVGQMIMVEAEYLSSNKNDIKRYGFGGIFYGENAFPTPNIPSKWVKTIQEYQNLSKMTRMQLPLFVAANIYHGNNKLFNTVIFPHNIGVGSTFEPELAEKIGKITALETLPIGINLAFLPTLSIPVDLRWGQVYETYSENPDMVGKFIKHYLKGLQNENISNKYSLLACIRGYPGEGGLKNGIYNGNIEITTNELTNIHLKPFKIAIENGAKAIMLSYASFNGVEVHGSIFLVQDLLRKELKFDGLIFSEQNAFYELPGNYEDQILTAIETGIDIFLISHEYKKFFQTLVKLIKEKKVSEERINESIKRILKLKEEYNLLKKSELSIYSSDIAKIGSKEHREISREIVRKSIVLLKNNGILPLTNTYKRILVCGKNAKDVGNQCGGWTIYKNGSWQRFLHLTNGMITKGTSIYYSLKERLKDTEIVYQKEPPYLKQKEYDLAIAVIGERPYAEKNGYRKTLTLDYEDFLHPDIEVLEYRDTRVIRKILQAKIPLIVIYIGGRPLLVKNIVKKSSSFLTAWLPGTEGDGVVDVLLGEYSPTGKLPFRWPKNVFQNPIKYNKKQNYLFPHEFGLSY